MTTGEAGTMAYAGELRPTGGSGVRVRVRSCGCARKPGGRA
ncbi:hypothetical protein [Kitasatospora sp. NA04385]|nr:hypothetical protein [Kitasatospora sp. NA04385]